MVERTADERLLTSEIVKRLNEDARRIRFIEQNIEKLETAIGALEETVLVNNENLKKELGKIHSKVDSLSNRLSSVENDVLKVSRLLGKTVTKDELKQMELFIDLINPITSKFVTKDEMEREFEERLKKKV